MIIDGFLCFCWSSDTKTAFVYISNYDLECCSASNSTLNCKFILSSENPLYNSTQTMFPTQLVIAEKFNLLKSNQKTY